MPTLERKDRGQQAPRDERLDGMFGEEFADAILGFIADLPRGQRSEARHKLAVKIMDGFESPEQVGHGYRVRAIEGLLTAIDSRIDRKFEAAMDEASMPPLEVARIRGGF